MWREYVHDTGETVRAIGGEYCLEKVDRIKADGREVLYVLGYAVFDTTCCGTGGCRFASVQGYIRRFQTRKDHSGRWVSEVEPVSDPEARQRITEILEKMFHVQQVRFD